VVINRKQIDPLRTLKKTLREHYQERRAHYQKWPDFYDNDLLRLFSSDTKYRARPRASRFLREIKPDLRRMVARWTGEYQYTIDQVLDDIIKRCRELRLRLTRSAELTRLESIVMVTVQTMNYLHGGHHRVAL
jgi:hypothetical protein